MSSTCRLLGSQTKKAMLCRPIGGATKRVLQCASSGSLTARATANSTYITASRTMSSFPTGNSSSKPQQNKYHSNINSNSNIHTPHTRATTTYRLGTATNSNTIHRRSMVTITQTKSSDVTPLFSTHVVDDVSPTSSTAGPTYVVNEDTTLIVTESCLKQVERLLNQRRARAEQPENYDDGYFLRVFVDAGGCSGFQYQFEVDDELDDEDDVVIAMAEIHDDHGTNGSTVMRPRVVVDETSMGFLEGSTIDYVMEMIKSAFVVSDNPQSESACGCGSSFAMKNFDKFGAND